MPSITAPLRRLLDRGDQSLRTGGELVLLARDGLGAAVTDVPRRAFPWAECLEQAWFMAKVSLLPTVLVSIPFGVIVAIQVGGLAGQIGATAFQGAVNGIGVLRQGAPLVTSLMIAGVVGSAVTADLGAREVREENDALRVMGVSPIRRLVAPRLVAAVVVSLVLASIVATVSIITSWALVVGRGSVGSGAYFAAFGSFARSSDVVLMLLKAVAFGLIATIVACHKGLTARGGPQGVADAVNQSVVLSVILLALVNVAMTQAYAVLVLGTGA